MNEGWFTESFHPASYLEFQTSRDGMARIVQDTTVILDPQDNVEDAYATYIGMVSTVVDDIEARER